MIKGNNTLGDYLFVLFAYMSYDIPHPIQPFTTLNLGLGRSHLSGVKP